MSSRKHQTALTESKDDNYEAAVLDFLNRELAASQTSGNQSDQSADLDAIVSDLLQQAITESDQLQEGETSTAEDEAAAMIASLTLEPVEASDFGSGLVENLDRGLGQNVSEEDLWDSIAAHIQPPEEADMPDTLILDSALMDTAGPDTVIPPVVEPPVPVLPPLPDKVESRPFEVPAEQKAGIPRPSLYGDVVFRPAVAPARRLPVKALAVLGALIIAAGGIYLFLSSRGGTSETASVPPGVPAPVATESENRIPPPVQPPSKAEKPKKASPPPSRNVPAATPPKAASANPTQRSAPLEKSTPASNTPQLASSLKESVALIPPPAPAKKVETKAAAEQKAVPEKPAATLPATPAPAAAAPALNGSTDKTPPSATPANTILVTDAAEKAPSQLVASASTNIEPLQPRSQPLLTAPAPSRVLVPAVPISQPSPSYPELALRSRTSAAVVLELQVDERGRVSRATPVSGPVLFHSAAVAAALKWRYKPATIDGKNVPSSVRVTINFTLNK